MNKKIKSNGGSTPYYVIPEHCRELNDLIEYKEMNFALGNIFKACYRFGEKDGIGKMYDLNKIIFFAERLKNIVEQEQKGDVNGNTNKFGRIKKE
jgi:hypothetical protein